MNDASKAPPPDRRDFFKRVLAGALGGLLGLVPLGAGLAFFLDPLRRKSSANGAVRVATLEAVPADGVPRKFPVLATKVDAWNKTSETPIGAVYLRRTANGQLEALNVVCPHAGCFVDYKPDKGLFLCPCHNSTFTLAGRIEDRASPASRGLDTLEVEVRRGDEVRVKFQDFEAGHAEKIPKA